MLPCALRTWRPSPKMKEANLVKRTHIRFVAAFFFSIGLIGDALVARLNVAMRLTQMAALSKNEGSHYREANTRPLCCIIFLFNQSDGRFVHRSCPIGSRLGIFRGQDGKWRKSQRKRHDRCSPNSSIWNAGARNPPAQWSLGGRADQRPRTIRARPGHRRDNSSSPRIRLLGSGVGEA